jgi:hypothetical protein
MGHHAQLHQRDPLLSGTWVPVWVDKHGDIWVEGDDGLLHSYETAPFSREHVERKWGPLKAKRALAGSVAVDD